MHDAAAAVIQLTAPGRIGSARAEAIAMHDLAVEQIGDGGEPDMRMRPHVDAVAGAKHRRPDMVEENERPDHARRAPTAARDGPGSRRDRPCAARSPARWRRSSAHRRKSGSLAGKKLMTSSSRAVVRPYSKGAVVRPPPLTILRALSPGFGHRIGDEARLREGGDMDLGRPIFGLETARLAIARGDGFDRMLPQPFIVARKCPSPCGRRHRPGSRRHSSSHRRTAAGTSRCSRSARSL